jgi:hypothetical protein
MTGKVPFHEKSDHSVMYLVTIQKKHPERPELHIPTNSQDGNKLWDLLVACWSSEPEARPSAVAVAAVVSRIAMLALLLIVILWC